MRLVFLGTPEAAVPSLRALVGAGHEVALVVSRADARRGRRGEAAPSPVKAAALELGLPVSDRVADAVGPLAAGAELGVVVAYGRLIRPGVLAQLAMVNVHFSLLPRWRGAAPVERAILAGDETTGVCIMALEETLDTGAIYRRAEVAIGPDEHAEDLRGRLASLGADLLTAALADGLGVPETQCGEITYAAKIEPEDRHLEWTEATAELLRRVRIGRAWTTVGGDRLLVAEAVGVPSGSGDEGSGSAQWVPGARPGTLDGGVVRTGDGGVRLLTVQPAGRRPQPAAEWLRSLRPAPGTVLGG